MKFIKKHLLKISIFCLSLLFILNVKGFLSKTETVESEVLVIEGWISTYALNAALYEFKVQDYKVLITTGGPVSRYGFSMTYNSSLKFVIPKSNNVRGNAASTIEVGAAGSSVENIYAHFKLAVNDSIVDSSYTSRDLKTYAFRVNLSQDKIRSVSVIFDNDGYRESEDRNLLVRYIKVNELTMGPFSEDVTLNFQKNGINVSRPMYRNYAEKSKYYLQEKGDIKAKIYAAPAPFVKIDRTYESALAVSKLLKTNFPELTSINVLSEGAHSRRTWLMYKKAFGDDFKVGIIAIEGHSPNSPDWWKSTNGIINVLVQFVKYIYAQFIFYPFA